MTLVFVDSVPKKAEKPTQDRRLEFNKLQRLIRDFYNDHRKMALIQLDAYEDYKSMESYRQSIRQAVQRSGYQIQVYRAGNNIYLIKN